MRYLPSFALVISSALLYAGAYLMPNYLWWTTTIFLIPLFHLIICNKLTLHRGLVWSTIAFSLHLFGVLEALFYSATGSFMPRIVLSALVLATAISYGTLWFIGLQYAQRLACRPARLCGAVVVTWLFFLFLERACLWMLGSVEGYLLFNPLVPLIECPIFLYSMPKMGPVAFLFLFITAQALVSAALVWGRWWWLLVFLSFSFFVISSLLFYPPTWVRHDYQTLVCATAQFKQHDSVTYTARVMRDYGKALLASRPEAEVIFFPESAIECPILPGEPQIVKLLNHQHLGKPITILTGGFRWDSQQYRNTMYWIHDGALIDLFDKRHAMALTERASGKYYFKKSVEINPSKRKRPVWHISPDFTVIPYICSELFFNNYPDHMPRGDAVLVALCNDKWLLRDTMRYNMLLGARFRALQWQVPIIYVAYHYQALCEPNGAFQKLTSYQVLKHQEVVDRD